MRPIKLILRAFGPYAKEQVVDFRELGDRNFFLIHGPTGAGKTSIFDGISFALYGDTSGEERQGKLMRSDYAHPNVLTEVTFDFSLGRDLYRITRSPEQERPKRRGGGTTKEPPRATLWKRKGFTDDSDEGKVIATQYSEATEKIEEILGFHSDQFRQVVMLPQGKFQKFLSAKSEEREAILEILFRTEIYRSIQETLKEKAKEIEDTRKAASNRRDICLKNADALSIEELVERLKKEKARSGELKKEGERRRVEYDMAQTALNEAKQTVIKLKEKSDAEESLKALEARADEFKQKRERLDKARKALSIIEIELELDRRRQDTKEAQRKAKEIQENLLKAREVNEEAEFRLNKEKAREPERNELARELIQLGELKEKVTKLIESRKVLDVAETEMKRITAEHNNVQKTLDDCRKKIDEAKEAHLVAEKETAKLDGANKTLVEANRNYEQRRVLDDLLKEFHTAQKDHDRATKELTRRERTLDKERKTLGSLEDEWIKGQASILAHNLKQSEPCPVCGSTDHPAPAHYDESLPHESDINEKRELVKKLERCQNKAQKVESETKETVAKLKSRINSLEENLGDLKNEDLSVLMGRVKDAEEAKNNAETAKNTAAALKEEISKLVITETQTNQTLISKCKDREQIIEARAKAQSLVTELEANIPEDLKDPEALKEAKKTAEKSLKVLKEALEEAQKNVTKASKQLSASEAAKKEIFETLEKAQRQEKITNDRFNVEIANKGFINLEEYQAVKLAQEIIEEYENEIKTYEGSLEAAKDRLKRAKKAAQDLEIPDIESLKEKTSVAKTAYENVVREETTLLERIRQIEKWLKELNSISDELKSLDDRYEVMGRIAEVANGKNQCRISFQRFVLATRLDDVLDAASKRLKMMSNGRYLLQRTGEQRDKRSSGGLDLEVYDAYTGKMRPVSTLSGGEGFQASLSLALGLADVVQSYSGGIYLEALFVDEGFGSLDSEALDLAIQTLRTLQIGGRMVVIISHVSDLKELIDTRLEVLPGRTGSTARFVIG